MKLGKIIKTFREESNITQSELAEGICSVKHVYFIEHNERVPSVDILRAFSEKLNVNLFDYIPYSDAEDPVAVRNLIYSFAQKRSLADFVAIEKLLEEACIYEDFNTIPYSYEIQLNRFLLDYFKSGDLDYYGQAITSTLESIKNDISKHWEYKSILKEMQYKFENVLSIYYNKKKHYDLEEELLVKLYKEIQNKICFDHYKRLYYMVSIEYLNCLYVQEKYEQTISLADDIIKNQPDQIHVRLHLIYYFKAMSQEALDIDSFETIKKGMFLWLASDELPKSRYINYQEIMEIYANKYNFNMNILEGLCKN